jgi:hypothetical protein
MTTPSSRPPLEPDMLQLPNPQVITKDRVPVEMGMSLYLLHSPEVVLEYDVIHDFAWQHPSMRHWEILVLGAKLPIVSTPSIYFVVDLQKYLELWEKRHR